MHENVLKYMQMYEKLLKCIKMNQKIIAKNQNEINFVVWEVYPLFNLVQILYY